MKALRSINQLKSLIQCEIDTFFILTEAIHKIKDQNIQYQLTSFKQQCTESIRGSSELLKQLGGKPPQYDLDLKGYLMKYYVTIQGLISDTYTLKALRTNELWMLHFYKKALKLRYSQDLLAEIQMLYNRNQEYTHEINTYIQQLQENPKYS